jgi:hypothetical protein
MHLASNSFKLNDVNRLTKKRTFAASKIKRKPQ